MGLACRDWIRGTRVPLAITLGALALAGTSMPAAAGAATDSKLAKILSPKTRLVRAGEATLRVRFEGRTTFQAFINERPVTGLFGPAKKGVRTAKLAVGTQLERGRNHVVVTTRRGKRRDFDTVQFVVARGQANLLRLNGAPKGTGSGAQLIRARSRATDIHLTASLNGKSVRRDFLAATGGVESAWLGADDGLRYGRNLLVVTAFDDRGRYDREVRDFTISRKAPLVGAGDDRRVTVGSAVQLDGSASRATRPGRSLDYAWSIAKAPEGSEAKLTDATAAKPAFVPDVNGEYVLQAAVTEPSGSAAASTQEVTVIGQPPVPEVGWETSVSGAGITFGPYSYPNPGPGPVQMLVLERESLGLVSNASYGPSDDIGTAFAPYEGDGSKLVMLTGGARETSVSSSFSKDLAGVIADIGGATESGLNDPTYFFDRGTWSVIGIPGLPSGQAAQNLGLGIGTGTSGGVMKGFLGKDPTYGNFTFVYGDYTPFDTNLTNQTGTTANLMSVGDPVCPTCPPKTYESAAPAPGQSGFQMLVLDHGSLEPLTHGTWFTNTSSGPDVQQVSAMAGAIKAASQLERDKLYLIQSIGSPHPLENTWTSQLAPELHGVIGSSEIALNLLPSQNGGYAYVGSTSTQNAETALIPEDSTPAPAPAQLTGMLARTKQTRFEPRLDSAVDGVDLSMLPLAYQDPTPWPFTDPSDAGHYAALQYVTQQVGLGDLRAAYVSKDFLGNQTTYTNALKDVPYPGPSGFPENLIPFTPNEFTDVKNGLLSEFGWVIAVRAMQAQLHTALTDVEVSENGGAAGIAHEIASQISGNDSDKVETEIFNIVSNATRILAAVPGLQLAGPVGGVFGIMGVVSANRAGSQVITDLDTEASHLGADVLAAYGAALTSVNHVGDLLVSDFGKLKVAGPLALQGAWNISNDERQMIQTNLQLSTEQEFWGALLPTGYTLYSLQPGHNNGDPITPGNYACYYPDAEQSYHPWSKDPSSAYVQAPVEYHGSKLVTRPWALITDLGLDDEDDLDGLGYKTPPASLTDQLFINPDSETKNGQAGVGLSKPQFYEANFHRKSVSCDD